MLKRKLKKHDYSIEPYEYRNGNKIIYPVSDNSIYQIMGFALKIRDYKLALKNLKWFYLNTTPYPGPLVLKIESAIIWFKNNKFDQTENILHLVFAQEPRYKNIFNTLPIKGTLLKDGGFRFQDPIESSIDLERRILTNPDYVDFVQWVKERFALE